MSGKIQISWPKVFGLKTIFEQKYVFWHSVRPQGINTNGIFTLNNFRATVETRRTKKPFFVVFLWYLTQIPWILHNAWEKGVCTETNGLNGENLCYIILSRWCSLSIFLGHFCRLDKNRYTFSKKLCWENDFKSSNISFFLIHFYVSRWLKHQLVWS